MVAQSGIVSSSCVVGEVEYAIGQPFYKTVINSEGAISDGIIQGYATQLAVIPDIKYRGIIKLYPNPTYGNLTLNLEENGEYSILIYDCFGKLLNKFSNNEKEYVISLHNHNTGIYLIKIIFKNSINVFKIIKL
jgi:hypothetical protein